MPRGDGTGPAGMGSMTGRAAGYCAGYPVPGFMNRMLGRGMGMGRGGWGRRNWYYATGLTGWQRSAYGFPYWGAPDWNIPYGVPYAPTKEQEMEMLKNQAKSFEDALAGIQNRLEELEKEKKS